MSVCVCHLHSRQVLSLLPAGGGGGEGEGLLTSPAMQVQILGLAIFQIAEITPTVFSLFFHKSLGRKLSCYILVNFRSQISCTNSHRSQDLNLCFGRGEHITLPYQL